MHDTAAVMIFLVFVYTIHDTLYLYHLDLLGHHISIKFLLIDSIFLKIICLRFVRLKWGQPP